MQGDDCRWHRTCDPRRRNPQPSKAFMPRSPLTLFCVAPLLVGVAATVLPTTAFADLAFNAGAVSDYRYRGI